MNKRDLLKKKAVRTKFEAYYKAYKEARNRVSKIISNSKKEYYTTNIENNKGNPKKMWKHINQSIGKNSKTIYIAFVKTEHKASYEDKEITEEFNSYFSNVRINLSVNIPQTDCRFEQYITPVSSEFFPDTFQCLKSQKL